MSVQSALELIEATSQMRVLFAGDTIIDEYQYVTPLGKSPKELIVPVRHESTQVFRGGVEAAAAHARSFYAEVDILSYGPIVRKTRMIDQGTYRKLFEVHTWDGLASQNAQPGKDYDALVLTDFGHGEFRREYRMWVCEQPGFLAVNAQTNSANIGFNLITQYERADYMVIDEPEARLAAQDRESPIEEVLEMLADGRCPKMIITRGSQGAIGWEDGKFHSIQALEDRPVDTMGAGDAFFAVTAPMAMYGSIADLLLIGSAAAALKCAIVGHRESVKKDKLIDLLKGVL